MNMGLWKPNVKEMNDELLKRNVQVFIIQFPFHLCLLALINLQAGELNEIMMLKEECHKRDMIIAELKVIIEEENKEN